MTRPAPPISLSLRLRRLQRWLRCREDNVPCLALTGVDAHFNVGSSQLTKWLLGGSSGHRVLELDPNPLELDDTIVMITSSSIHLAIKRPVWDAIRDELLAYSSNVYVYPLDLPSSPDDCDYSLLMQQKSHALAHMLRGLHTVGIPLPMECWDGQMSMEMAHAVDCWPLLLHHQHQSGARGQPFSCRYQIQNIQGMLQRCYSHLDAAMVSELLQDRLPPLMQQFELLAYHMCKVPPRQRGLLTELQLASSLLAWQDLQINKSRTLCARKVVTVPSRVLLGSRTNDLALKAAPVSIADMSNGEDSAPCLHMVVEVADPCSQLRVARTCFLAYGCKPDHLFRGSQDVAASGFQLDDASTADTIRLVHLYELLVAAAHRAISHFSTFPGATAATARRAATQSLIEGSETQDLGLDAATLAANTCLAIWSLDPANALNPEPSPGSACVKTLRLTLRNITSQSGRHKGKLLGALVYADTFVDIPACGSSPAAALNLTEAVVPLLSVACTAEEAELKHQSTQNFFLSLKAQGALQPATSSPEPAAGAANGSALHAHTNGEAAAGAASPRPTPKPLLGALLAGPMDATLLTGSALVPVVPGALYCYQEGFVLVTKPNKAVYTMQFSAHARAIWIADLADPAQAEEVADGQGLPAIGQALVFEGTEGACGLPPACYLTDSRCLALPLLGLAPGESQQLFKVVLPRWKTACTRCAVPIKGAPQQHLLLGSDAALYRRHWYCLHRERKQYKVYVQDRVVQQALAQLECAELAAAAGSGAPQAELVLCGRLHAEQQQATITSSSSSSSSTSSSRSSSPSAVDRAAAGVSNVSLTQQNCQQQPSSAAVHKVVLLVGLPGSGHPAVVSALAQLISAVQAGSHVVGLCLPSNCAPHTRQPGQDCDMSLEQSLQGIPASATHALLAAPGFEDVPSILQLLASCPSFSSGACQLASIVTVLNPGCLHLDAAAQLPLPGLLEQLSPGYIDAVVLSDGPGVSVAQLEAAEQLLRLRNQEAPAVLLSRLVAAAEAAGERDSGQGSFTGNPREAAAASSSKQKRSQASSGGGRISRRKSNGDGKAVPLVTASNSFTAATAAAEVPSGSSMLATLLPAPGRRQGRLAREQLARSWACPLPGHARVAAGHGQLQCALVQLEGELDPQVLLQLVEQLVSSSRAAAGGGRRSSSLDMFSLLLAGLVRVPAAEGHRLLLQQVALGRRADKTAAAAYRKLAASSTGEMLLSLSACSSSPKPQLLPCSDMLRLSFAGQPPQLLQGMAAASAAGAADVEESGSGSGSFLSACSGSSVGGGAGACQQAPVANFVVAGCELDVLWLQKQLSCCCTGRVLITMC